MKKVMMGSMLAGMLGLGCTDNALAGPSVEAWRLGKGNLTTMATLNGSFIENPHAVFALMESAGYGIVYYLSDIIGSRAVGLTADQKKQIKATNPFWNSLYEYLGGLDEDLNEKKLHETAEAHLTKQRASLGTILPLLTSGQLPIIVVNTVFTTILQLLMAASTLTVATTNQITNYLGGVLGLFIAFEESLLNFLMQVYTQQAAQSPQGAAVLQNFQRKATYAQQIIAATRIVMAAMTAGATGAGAATQASAVPTSSYTPATSYTPTPTPAPAPAAQSGGIFGGL
ncbi:MAG: hypothetical protein LBG20_02620 [Holosporaceae bacterium]|jgi:hypothetical protein|nr:hypothetical protein [Holosporaceae bacterium]